MKETILIIDDDEHFRKFMFRLLESEYHVLEAESAEDARSIVKSFSLNLIILDMFLPGLSGIDFLGELNETLLHKVPVLIMSGAGDPDLVVQSFKMGVYDYIQKPERVEVILRRIENGMKIGKMLRFNDEIRSELLMASNVQKIMLPEDEYDGDLVRIRSWMRPLTDVGGDMFDYILFRDGRVVFYVADVVGHSISAALYTMMVKMLFHNTLKITDKPGSILTIMNDELHGTFPEGAFVTLFCGVLDPHREILEYASAGHEYPLLAGPDRVDEINQNQVILGPRKNIDYMTNKTDFKKGEVLFLFTDGVIDKMDEKGNMMGKDPVLELLKNRAFSTDEKFDKLVALVLDETKYAIYDDCTIMYIENIHHGDD